MVPLPWLLGGWKETELGASPGEPVSGVIINNNRLDSTWVKWSASEDLQKAGAGEQRGFPVWGSQTGMCQDLRVCELGGHMLAPLQRLVPISLAPQTQVHPLFAQCQLGVPAAKSSAPEEETEALHLSCHFSLRWGAGEGGGGAPQTSGTLPGVSICQGITVYY